MLQREKENKPKNNRTMIVSSKKFMTQLVESIGRMTAMCFEDGVKADKEVTRDLGKMRDALWEIRDALWLIKDILQDAAKEPEKPVQEDKTLGDIFEDMNKTMKESTLFDDVPKKYVPKKEDVPEVKLPFDGVGEFIPFTEAKRRLKPKTHRSVEDFCKVYGTIFRRVGNHRPEVFWNDALCDVQPREQKVRKKEERKRQKPPQEGMKQLQTWAKH